MTHNKFNQSHLTFGESVIICVIPATFFLVNGLLVNAFKFFEVSASIYTALIIFLLFFSFFFFLFYFKTRTNELTTKYFPIFIISAGFAILHYFGYKSAVGFDSLAYFARPFYTFFSSGYFSFHEQSFVTFGLQPIDNYWLPYNAEYFFTAVGSLFGASFESISSFMHITSNFLLIVALLAIILRHVSIIPGVSILMIFLTLMYVSHSNGRDLTATSIFRGFENKGLIFGFFYWYLINLFTPPSNKSISLTLSIVASLTLGFSSFAVSGNALFLLLPALALSFSRMLADRSFSVIISIVTLTLALLLGLLLYKFFETVDVYNVVSKDLTYRATESYESQSKAFSYSPILWISVVILIAATAVKHLQLAIQLTAFCVFSLFLSSEWFFQIFNELRPERALNFWRGAILLGPYAPILIALSFLISTISPSTQRKLTPAIAVTVILAGISFIPMSRPFSQVKIPDYIKQIAKNCKPESLVLANRYEASRIQVSNPSFHILVGREYFLNWQIANLPPNSIDRIRALNVRDASLYISISPTTKDYYENPEGFINTIKNEKPDIILAETERFTPDILLHLKTYEKTQFENKTIMNKTGVCSFKK